MHELGQHCIDIVLNVQIDRVIHNIQVMEQQLILLIVHGNVMHDIIKMVNHVKHVLLEKQVIRERLHQVIVLKGVNLIERNIILEILYINIYMLQKHVQLNVSR